MLSARGLSFAWGDKVLLDEVDLAIERGERVGVVGHNGAGKSTLLSLLAREREPGGGAIRAVQGVTVGLLAQEPRLDPQATVLEVVRSGLGELLHCLDEHERLCAVEGDADHARIAELNDRITELGGFDVDHRVEQVLDRLSVKAREEKIETLSGGERRRVDLARLLLSAPSVLLLDEPTNHLDADAIRYLAERLAHSTCVFISHDRAFVDDVATRLLEVDDGKLYSHEPPWESYLAGRLTRKDVEARTAHRRERLMLRELAWLRTGPKARTTKADARVDRAEQLIADVKADVVRRRERVMKVRKAEGRLGNTVLQLRGLSLGVGDRVFFEGLDLTFVEGERWGIVGPNGAGKTTLLRALLGDVEPRAGEIVRGKRTRMALFDQHRAELDPDATLEELLAEGDHVRAAGEKVHIATYLERFLFDGRDRYRKAGTLSGGERNRLQLARLLRDEANCLILDEPTNDLDVTTLGVLEDLLSDLEGVALVVSHDRRFLDRVCTGILAFEPASAGRAEHELVVSQGDYTHYERMAAEREALRDKPAAPAPADATDNKQSKPRPRGDGPRKRSYKEQREYEGIEEAVLSAESRREEVAAQIEDGSIFASDPAAGAALSEELSTLDAEIERLYARWQELEELRAS
jgi:ATP-binding cassette subfamily F protein uup